MRLLVIGRNGQLARSLAEREGEVSVVTVHRPGLDLAAPGNIAAMIERHRPDAIVNAAAYTAVDQAEDEPELAFAVNATAPGLLAQAAAGQGVPFVHVSTDYVFDGESPEPYDESAEPNPLGVYGRSKLAGEAAVRAAGGDGLIVRTAWVYSPHGRNFLKTMLALAQGRPSVRVVSDQLGNPTAAADVAEGVLAALRGFRREGRFPVPLAHLAGTGDASWFDFARHIMAVSAGLGGPSAEVVAIATADYPTRARRPMNSRLDSSLFAEAFGYRAPRWQESTERTLRRLLAAD